MSHPTRRDLLGAALLGGLSGTPRTDPAVASAVEAHRSARHRLAAIAASYEALAPGYDAHPAGSPEAAKLRRLEGLVDAATRSLVEASEALASALDRAGLAGVVSGPELVAVAPESAEGPRRVVVLPVRGIARTA